MENKVSKVDYSWIYVILLSFICYKITKCQNHEYAHEIMKDSQLRRDWNVNSIEEAEEKIEDVESSNVPD